VALSKGTVLKYRYKIIKKIGGGGYAKVYLAEDTLKEGLWAVKEMNPKNLSCEDENEVIEQFWFEAKILAKLKHDQLPVIEDFFEENKKYYIVMEYIEGKNLLEVITSGPETFPVPLITDWSLKICEVLEYLHSQEPAPVIFRDLKPENIMLDGEEEIKLIDFGISKIFDVNTGTRSPAKAISPYFSSTEQYGGHKTDERTDIYSLGATMYFLYTSNFPIDSMDRLLNNVVLDPPSSFNPLLPERIDRLILKTMEIKKEDRYQSVKEVKKELMKLCLRFKETGTRPVDVKFHEKNICPVCHRENPLPSKFCGGCGNFLE